MLSLRWRKILNDIIRDKQRAILVIISIAIGIISIGMIEKTSYLLQLGLQDSYSKTKPASSTIYTSWFDKKILDEIESLPEIKNVQGSVAVQSKIMIASPKETKSQAKKWKYLTINAFDNYKKLNMDLLYHNSGKWPPNLNEILLEHSAMEALKVKEGEFVEIELATGKKYRLLVSGTVYAPGIKPTSLSGQMNGYISIETLSKLGIPSYYNRLAFTVTDHKTNVKHIEEVSAKVRNKLASNGLQIYQTQIPEPGKHWAYDIIISMTILLQSMSILAVIMGSSLVFNTILATLTSQVRQIGIMQTIGAKPNDLLRMYMTMIVLYGIIALIIGTPIANYVANLALVNAFNMVNITIPNQLGWSSRLILYMFIIGLVIPILTALYPIIKGTHLPIREAIQGTEISGSNSSGIIDKLLEKIKGFSRPFLLSLRNTFRRKLRLMLTLVTLSLGGAIVISIFSVYSSMQLTIDRSLKYTQYDIRMNLSNYVEPDVIKKLITDVPGVKNVESWGKSNANILYPNGHESQDLTVLTLPATTKLVQPTIVNGRWLQQSDKMSIVLEMYSIRNEPNLKVGDNLVLKINGQKYNFQIAGFARKVAGQSESFVGDMAMPILQDNNGITTTVQIVTSKHNRSIQENVAEKVETLLKDKGINIESRIITSDLKKLQFTYLNVLLVFLMLMGIFLTVIAMLSLMASMSTNVLERTREFGILRSIGASDLAVWKIVVMEGGIIGIISWGISSLLAIPISNKLCETIGLTLYKTPLDYTFPLSGVIFWLVAVTILSAIACFIPALRATRLNMKDILSYE